MAGIVLIEDRLLVWRETERRLQAGVAAVRATDKRVVRRGCDGGCG